MNKSDAARLNGKKGGRPRKHGATLPKAAAKTHGPSKTHETQETHGESVPTAASSLHPLLALCARREQLFISELLADPKVNQRQAFYRAGYQAKTDNAADQHASKVLRKPKVAAAFRALMSERAARCEVRQDRVLQELARIGFADIRQLFNEQGNLKAPNELSDDAAAALVSIEVQRSKTTVTTAADGSSEKVEDSVVKVKAADKIGALSLLARHLGMLHDKVDHTHTITLEEALDASRSGAAA